MTQISDGTFEVRSYGRKLSQVNLRIHTTNSAPIEIACKMGVTKKTSFSRLQTHWLIQHCHFLEVQDISDHSSVRNGRSVMNTQQADQLSI